MEQNILLSPPVTFLVTLAASIIFAWVISLLAFKPKVRDESAGKSYACGEDVPTNMMQPDYTQFFPFAFFFTILHVVALIIATVPKQTLQAFVIAVVYIIGAVTGLFILFRKD